MKLSEMTNDQAAEVMIKLAEPIGLICDDEEAVKMIDEYKKRSRMPLFYAVGQLIPRLIGYLMQKHKGELYQIIAALTDKKVEEVGGLNLKETVQVFRDSYDEVMAVFFPSSGNATKRAGGKSSAS